MPYVVGIVFSLSVAVFARRVGFDRDRAFYPTVLIVIALYYVVVAAMSGSVRTGLLESPVMTAFTIAAVAGYKSSAWLVVGGLAGLLSSLRPRCGSWPCLDSHPPARVARTVVPVSHDDFVIRLG